jgi:predicted nucleic acid-binding protein
MKSSCIKHHSLNDANTEIHDDPTPRINLATSEDIRREMAKVYRETRCNKILPSNGTKLVYMLINILKAYEVTEIEKRLTDLELVHLDSGAK